MVGKRVDEIVLIRFPAVIVNDQHIHIIRDVAIVDDAREVVSLVRIAGLSSREAAAQLGKSPSGVRKILSRALVQLSIALGE